MNAEPVNAPLAFIDTNMVCYLFGSDLAKALRAEELLQGGGLVSTQVLAEMTNVARKKAKMEWAEIDAVVDMVCAFCEVKPVTFKIFSAAKHIARHHNVHIYDAQIIAAALDCDATILWSEDMQDGRQFENRLTVRNPFKQDH